MTNTNTEQEHLNKMLLEAAKVGSTALIEHFIQSGADTLAQDENDKTALEYTISGQHFEATKKLVELGALKKGDEELRKPKEKIEKDIRQKYMIDSFVLYKEDHPQYEETAKLYNSVSRYYDNTYYSTKLLEQAIDNNDIETTKLLLNSGAKIAIISGSHHVWGDRCYNGFNTEKNLLNNPIKNGNIEMFDTLLAFFKEDYDDFYRRWEIKEVKKTAVIYNQPQIFDKLDKAELDRINLETSESIKKDYKKERDQELHSYMYLAVKNNHTSMVENILNKMPQDKLYIDQYTICAAAITGNMDILELLLPHNNDKDHWHSETILENKQEKIFSYSSAFVEAARRGHTKVIEKLVDHGLDVNSCYYYETIKSVNYKDEVLSKKIEIPLFAAAENGHIETVKFLLEKGVSLDQRNDRNETVYDVAQKSQQFEIYELIQKEQKRRQEEQRKQQEAEEKKKVTALKISKAKAKLKNKTQDALALKEAGNVELNKAVIEESTINKINPTVLKLLKRKMSNNK